MRGASRSSSRTPQSNVRLMIEGEYPAVKSEFIVRSPPAANTKPARLLRANKTAFIRWIGKWNLSAKFRPEALLFAKDLWKINIAINGPDRVEAYL